MRRCNHCFSLDSMRHNDHCAVLIVGAPEEWVPVNPPTAFCDVIRAMTKETN